MDDENKDVNSEETGEESSTSKETTSNDSEVVKDTEDAAKKADELLKDGTSPKKDIVVSKEKYDDRNEKAKLYEAHAPLLDKVLKNPELVEELLETHTKGNLEVRLERIEEERKAAKRQELREAVVGALSKWNSFDKDWPEIREDVDRMVKRGLSYKEAIRRSFLALHPEEVQAEAEGMAREGANSLGQFSSSGGRSPQVTKVKGKTNLGENDKRVARALGKSEEEYAGLLEKHDVWMDSRGFNTPMD